MGLGYSAGRPVPPATTPCATAAFSADATYIVGGVATDQPSTVLPTPKAVPIAAGGATQQFCFDVQLPTGAANNLQGLTAGVTWESTATSD